MFSEPCSIARSNVSATTISHRFRSHYTVLGCLHLVRKFRLGGRSWSSLWFSSSHVPVYGLWSVTPLAAVWSQECHHDPCQAPSPVLVLLVGIGLLLPHVSSARK